MSEPSAATGVLYGPKIHVPVQVVAKPSKEPGFGEISKSVCGYYKGIVYDFDWIEFHHPDAQLCLRCFPDGVTS